jgi:hypothetical protein
MLNVKTLTDTMSRMELPQLQQYAALHKNDPYIVTLALSIANQKKQMKAGQDGQAGRMPQPKVADQQIAQMSAPPPQQMAPQQQMLPEDQGIGTLPARNMQNFAGGGIVAFEGGGSTSALGRFFSDLTAQTPEQTRQAYVRNALMRKKTALTEQGGIFGLKQQTPEQREIYERTKAEIDYLQKLVDNPNYVPPVSATAPAPAADPYDPATATRRSKFVDPLIDKRRSPAASVGSGDASAAPASAAAVPAIAPTTFQRTSIPDIDVAKQLELYKSSMPTEIVDPLAKQRQEANAPLIQAAGRAVSLFEQEVQNRTPAFEERLKNLDKKEARINTMEDRNSIMSMIEAGFDMMSGESPHAFVNIGKGAKTGIKSYAEGQAKVEAARDKLEEAKARIEEFRRNEDMMTSKERRSVLRDYDNTVAAAQRDMFSGVEKMYGITREDIVKAIADRSARESVKAQIGSAENLGIAGIESQQSIAKANMANAANISREDNLSRERVARMPSQLERILRDPVMFERYSESQLGPANVRREMALRTQYYENPQLKQSYPTVQDYLLANGVGGQDGVSDGSKVLSSRPGPKP